MPGKQDGPGRVAAELGTLGCVVALRGRRDSDRRRREVAVGWSVASERDGRPRSVARRSEGRPSWSAFDSRVMVKADGGRGGVRRRWGDPAKRLVVGRPSCRPRRRPESIQHAVAGTLGTGEGGSPRCPTHARHMPREVMGCDVCWGFVVMVFVGFPLAWWN